MKNKRKRKQLLFGYARITLIINLLFMIFVIMILFTSEGLDSFFGVQAQYVSSTEYVTEKSTYEVNSTQIQTSEIATATTSAETISEIIETQIQAETSPETPAPTEEPIFEPAYVHLVAVGDNLMHMPLSTSGLQADGSYNYDYNFSQVTSMIQAADIAIINQETVIGGNELGIQTYPCFNGRTEMADAIVKAGFDVVLGANNHILDQGANALLHMIHYFHSNYPQIVLLGIHESWETRDEIPVIDCNGIRIAMLNYTDILNSTYYYSGNEYLTDYLDYERLGALIQNAKAISDFVVVFPHWGTEYNLGIDQKQLEETAFLAEQGVDLVIGAHPHVVEPLKYMDRPDGGKMLVYYSLGNFQSIQAKEMTLIEGMADVIICKTEQGTYISDFNMQFLANDYRINNPNAEVSLGSIDSVTTYPWELYSRELAATSAVYLVNPNFSVDAMFELQAQMQEQVTAERLNAGL